MGIRSMDQMTSLNTFDLIFQLLFTSTFRGRTSKSNSKSALSSPSKEISHPSFGFLPFSNLTHKTETEIANRWETTNSNNPHGPIIMIGESETGRKSQIIFMTPFFWNVLHSLQCFVPATAKCANMQIQNHFSPGKPARFDFSSSSVNLQSHTY
jgi:hypothetical protein